MMMVAGRVVALASLFLLLALSPRSETVIDFGATPDDMTDDTSAFQRALDRGGTISVPAGRYLVGPLQLRGDDILFTGTGVLVKNTQSRGVLLTISGNGNRVSGLTFRSKVESTIPGAENDTIRVEGRGNTITSIHIGGSDGNGVRINGGAENEVRDSLIEDVWQNSILVSNPGANKNTITGNILRRTVGQNNIFITADDGTRPTKERIYGNIVRNNICEDASDTGIESGQNADGTIIEGNIVSGSRNPAILLRDGKNVLVQGNVIKEASSGGRPVDHSGIAIVPLFESDRWLYGAIIRDNRIDSEIVKSGIYVGGSGVMIEANEIRGRSSERSYGITLAGRVSDITIARNFIDEVERGIDLNFDGGRHKRENVNLDGNEIKKVKIQINRYNIYSD